MSEAQTAAAPTDREIFERVKTHLLTQNKQAKVVTSDDRNSLCRYRDPAGLKCAVGCLITDEAYDPLMESASVPHAHDGVWSWQVYSSNPAAPEPIERLAKALNASCVPARHSTYNMLCDLQAVHDDNEPEQWSRMLRDMNEHFTADGGYLSDDYEGDEP